MPETEENHSLFCQMYEDMIKNWGFYRCAEQLGLMEYNSNRNQFPAHPKRIAANMEALRKRLDVLIVAERANHKGAANADQ